MTKKKRTGRQIPWKDPKPCIRSNVREILDLTDLSWREIGEHGLWQPTIRGSINDIGSRTLKTLKRIADATGVAVKDLFDEADSEDALPASELKELLRIQGDKEQLRQALLDCRKQLQTMIDQIDNALGNITN